MSSGGYTVQVTNLSPAATERDLYDFFSFSGAVEHIEILRSGDYPSTAYVTFKDAYALETAVLLSGATIIDQPVCITSWEQHDEACSFWDQYAQKVKDDTEFSSTRGDHLSTTPREAVTMAQEVVVKMLSMGYQLSKDALIKAKAFDESHGVSATAAAKLADLSKRIGLTDRVCAGVDAVKSVDDRYRVSETTKTVISVTGRTAATVANSVVSSSYFSAGAMLVSDALSRAAKVASDLAKHGSK